MCNTGSQIKFQTLMLRSGVSDYSDAYILVTGIITNEGAGADDAAKQADKKNKGAIFKDCAPFIDCISKIKKYSNR